MVTTRTTFSVGRRRLSLPLLPRLSHPLIDRAINPARKLNVDVDSSFDFFFLSFFARPPGTIIKYNAGSVSVSQIIVVCDTLRLACQLATVYEVTKYAGSLHHAHRPASSRAIRATRSFPIVRQSHQLIPVQGRIYIYFKSFRLVSIFESSLSTIYAPEY